MAGKDNSARETRRTAPSSTRGWDGSRRKLLLVLASIAAVLALGAVGVVHLSHKASLIKSELSAATRLVPVLKKGVAASDTAAAAATVSELRAHTTAAKQAVDDPLWTLGSVLPWIGPNLSAVTEVARSADDVASLALDPLISIYSSISWESLLPSSTGTNLEPLAAASPTITVAADAMRMSAERLNRIGTGELLPQVAEPLHTARNQLDQLTGALDTAADAARVAPDMLGAQVPRNYLLIIQNNAETRASGGIPGALAVLTLDRGKLTLGAQSTANALGRMSPIVQVDPEQRAIYSDRLGAYMQDVNLTPDFPTTASTAQAMWERQTGQRVQGVISIDPVALGYILDATGPVTISDPGVLALVAPGLPTELSGENVVQTLLSDVYSQVSPPSKQDVYFAGVAKEIFAALSNSDAASAEGLIKGLSRGAAEGRISIWSEQGAEQSVIAKYALSGSVSGPSVEPAQFGVYFNDGTGAKMDFYVKRTVQIIQECATNGYSGATVRITSTNTAPLDAATSLPAYVTAGGQFGVPPGTVQTNVTAYGPSHAHLAGAARSGTELPVSSHRHDGRPVGTTTVTLAPGETVSVDIQFDKIVQNAAPKLRVTPTVQDLREVILDTKPANCAQVP